MLGTLRPNLPWEGPTLALGVANKLSHSSSRTQACALDCISHLPSLAAQFSGLPAAMPKKSGSAKSQQPEVQLAEPESGGKRRKGEEAAPAAKAAPASKKQRKAAAAEVVEAAEAAEGPSTSGRGGSEIDELFGALRKGSKAKAGAAKLEATEEAQPQVGVAVKRCL